MRESPKIGRLPHYLYYSPVYLIKCISCSLRFNLRIWKKSNTPATSTEAASANGIDTQAPIAPYLGLRISNNGKRKSNCRVVERNIAKGARPIYWKKPPATIWKPTNGKTVIAMPKP